VKVGVSVMANVAVRHCRRRIGGRVGVAVGVTPRFAVPVMVGYVCMEIMVWATCVPSTVVHIGSSGGASWARAVSGVVIVTDGTGVSVEAKATCCTAGSGTVGVLVKVGKFINVPVSVLVLVGFGISTCAPVSVLRLVAVLVGCMAANASRAAGVSVGGVRGPLAPIAAPITTNKAKQPMGPMGERLAGRGACFTMIACCNKDKGSQKFAP